MPPIHKEICMSFNSKETKQLLINIASGFMDGTDYPLLKQETISRAQDVIMSERIPFIASVSDGVIAAADQNYDLVAHIGVNKVKAYSVHGSNQRTFYVPASVTNGIPSIDRVKNWVSPLDAIQNNEPCMAYAVRLWVTATIPNLQASPVDGQYEIPSTWMSSVDESGDIIPGWFFNYEQGIVVFAEDAYIPENVELFIEGFVCDGSNIIDHFATTGFQTYIVNNTVLPGFATAHKGYFWVAGNDITGINGVDLNKGDRVECVKVNPGLNDFTVSEYWFVSRGGRAAEIATSTSVGVIKPASNMEVSGDGTLNVKAATTNTLGIVKGGQNISVNVSGTLIADPATATTSGTVIPKDGLSVAVDGSLTVKAATGSSIGGIKVGNNVNADANGTLTVNNATDIIPGAVKIDAIGGAPILDATLKLDPKYFPPLETIQRGSVPNLAARLALPKSNKFQIIIQTDVQRQYYLNEKQDPAVEANWTDGGSVAASVTSFKTRTGEVVPLAGDYTADMVNAIQKPADADGVRRVVVGQTLQEELPVNTVLDQDFVYSATQSLTGLAGKEIGDNIKDLRETKVTRPVDIDGITYVMKDQQWVDLKTLTPADTKLAPLNANDKIDSIYLPDSFGGGKVLLWDSITSYEVGDLVYFKPELFPFSQYKPWEGVYVCTVANQGGLQPDIIQWEPFKTPLPTNHTWNQNMIYQQGDIAVYNDNVYYARIGGNGNPEEMIVWTKITRPYKADAYSTARGYSTGAVVNQQGCLAFANATIPVGTPFKWGLESGPGDTTWQPILNSGEFPMTFKGRCENLPIGWAKGDVFSLGNSGAIYVCYKPATYAWDGTTLPPKAYFLNVTSGTPTYVPVDKVTVPSWKLSEMYVIGDIVTYTDNKLYRSNGTIPVNTPWAVGTTGATWALVSNNPIEEYVSTKAYTAMSLVRYTDGNVYFSNAAIPANTAWATGTTGATWNGLGSGMTLPVFQGSTASVAGKAGILAAAPVNTQDYVLYGSGQWKPITAASTTSVITKSQNPAWTAQVGGKNLFVDRQSRITADGILSTVRTGGFSELGAIVVVRPSAGEASFAASGTFTCIGVTPIGAGVTSVQPGISVKIGDYVGFWKSTDTAINGIYSANGPSMNLVWCGLNTMPTLNSTLTVSSGNNQGLAYIGFDVTVINTPTEPNVALVVPKVAIGTFSNNAASTIHTGIWSVTHDTIGITSGGVSTTLPAGKYMVEWQWAGSGGSQISYTISNVSSVSNATMLQSTSVYAFYSTGTWNEPDAPVGMAVVSNTNAGSFSIKVALSAASGGTISMQPSRSWFKITKLD